MCTSINILLQNTKIHLHRIFTVTASQHGFHLLWYKMYVMIDKCDEQHYVSIIPSSTIFVVVAHLSLFLFPLLDLVQVREHYLGEARGLWDPAGESQVPAD